MTERSFFEELDKNLSSDENNDFSYQPPEKETKGFPVVLIGLGIVFVVVVIVLFSELLSSSDKSNEATLPETEIQADVTEEELLKAEEQLEKASTAPENVKPTVTKPEVKAPAVKKEVKQIQAPKKIKTPVTKKTTTQKTQTITQKAASVKPKTSSTPVPTGWQVQLAAVSTREKAEGEWLRLRQKHALLQDQKHAIIEKQLSGRTLYRLRVVGLTSRDSADKLCADLQALGLSCLVMQ